MVDTLGQVGYIIKDSGMENKPREIKPGLYILDSVDPPIGMVMAMIDGLIASMPDHKKLLEQVKWDLIRRYLNDRD